MRKVDLLKDVLRKIQEADDEITALAAEPAPGAPAGEEPAAAGAGGIVFMREK